MTKTLLLAVVLLSALPAGADSDRTKGVLIISAPSDSIRLDFAKDKACRGLHEVLWDYRSKELFDWSLSIAGDEKGRSEVLLINSATDPHHYVFLGANIREGVHKACRIVNGEEKAAWLAFEK